MELYEVIMAGGSGTRFWPLSRINRPKQFINVSGNDILLNETIKRMDGIIKRENVFVVTGINLGLLLELYLSSENEQMKVVALKAIESSKNNIRLFAYPINEYVEQNEQKEVNLW